MAGPASSNFKLTTFPTVIAIDRLCVDRRASTRRAASSKSETTMESRARAAGLGCVRGTAVALTCEAAAALGIYAIWQLLRLVF